MRLPPSRLPLLRLTLLSLPLLLAACVEETSPPAKPLPADQSCGAEALGSLVGQPASVLQTMRFGTTTRIIRPGMAVTADYSASRLNIMINDRERIIRVTCG